MWHSFVFRIYRVQNQNINVPIVIVMLTNLKSLHKCKHKCQLKCVDICLHREQQAKDRGRSNGVKVFILAYYLIYGQVFFKDILTQGRQDIGLF